MGKSSRNSAIVKKAFEELVQVTMPTLLLPVFENIAADLLQDALICHTFTSFTGNTLTSFAAGVYLNNTLETVILASDSLAAPLRVKIRNGEYVWLEEPYEGGARGQRGMVDLNAEYGYETSLKFLQGFQFKKRYPFSVVLTTGTEYSEYLEERYNVLEDTYDNARSIIINNIRKV